MVSDGEFARERAEEASAAPEGLAAARVAAANERAAGTGRVNLGQLEQTSPQMVQARVRQLQSFAMDPKKALAATKQHGRRGVHNRAAEQGRPIVMRALLTAMRHAAKSVEIAELAVAYRDQGVAGFDIAGAEAGFPPTRHLDAFEYLRRENAHFTIHAGEAFGLPSIWEAIQYCGAERLGHGVRITDDITIDGVAYPELDEPARAALPERVRAGEADVRLGRLAAFVRDRRIALEVCPLSNLQTGAALSLRSHPISFLLALGFRVALSTDNRLMSDTSMTKEMTGLVSEAGWGLDDLEKVTVNAMKSAFIPFDERLAIIMDVIKPGFAAARA